MAGCTYDSPTMRPRADVILLHLLCKPENEPPRHAKKPSMPADFPQL